MVCQAANALVELGVQAGDRVAIYMPMIPEAVVAMLACARLGAPHSVVFGGFSAEALAGRILDADARVVITADGGYRRGAAVALKPHVDEALRAVPRRAAACWWCGAPARRWTGTEGRDVWWHDIVDRQPDQPRGRVLRRRAPALHHVHERDDGQAQGHPPHDRRLPRPRARPPTGCVFDIKPETDVFWTAADIGWVTGHSYIVYGPLANGTTSVMYEGTPDAGGRDRWWRIVEDYKVSILYTAPTTIRTLMKWGEELPGRPRPLEPAPARLGRRAHQPRGLDVVPQARRAATGARSSTPGGRPRPGGS